MIDAEKPYWRFTWDDDKRLKNMRKHNGLDFKDAVQVFNGTIVSELDTREDYGEDRLITLGLLDGKVVAIAHLESSQDVHLISMRYAEPYEEERYYWTIAGRP